ncbi:MAG: protein kinase [Candidatus Adiutrix sp.]|jgi:serine/threonine protein kinase|nr:protein kinase [Candidatus Adiutrix sp.]
MTETASNSDSSSNLQQDDSSKAAAPVAACPFCKTNYRLKPGELCLRTICRKCGREFHLLSPSEAPATRLLNPAARDAEMKPPVGNLWLNLKPGQIIDGSAEVVSFLGRGGLSQVFKVRHLTWQIDMALKLPKPSTVDYLSLDMLRSEADVWLKPARHPNLVSCHFVRNIMGRPALFLECIKGRPLGVLMQPWEGGRIPRLYRGGSIEAGARIIDMMIQAARGLEYAHELGLLHLDIKPMNLFVEPGGRLLIGDFGLVRNLLRPSPAQGAALASAARLKGSSSLHVDDAATRLSNSKVMGTYQYFSPEAADGRTWPRPSFDLWALTLTALECFIGRRPWEMGSMVGQALDNYLSEKTAVPVSPRMAAFFKKALSENEAGRHRDAGRMADDLTEIYEKTTGRPYARPRPKEIPETADRLNNKAVSLMELDRPQEAGRLWREALALTPDHAASLFNQSLDLFRQKALSADDFEKSLDELGKPARLEAERNDLAAALAAAWLELGRYEEAGRALAAPSGQPDHLLRRRLRMMMKTIGGGAMGPPPVASFLLSRVEEPDDEMTRNSTAFMVAIKAAAAVGDVARLTELTSHSLTPGGQGEMLRLKESLYLTARRLALVGVSEDRTDHLPMRPELAAMSPSENLLILARGRKIVFCRKDEFGSWSQRGEAVKVDENICALTLNPSGSMAAVFTENGRLWDVDAQSARVRKEMAAHDGPVRGALVTPDGRQLISIGADGLLMAWDSSPGYLDKGAPLLIRAPGEGPLTALAAYPDGRLIFAAGPEDEYFFSPAAMEIVGQTGRQGRLPFLAVPDPFSRYLLVAGQDGSLDQIFPKTGRIMPVAASDFFDDKRVRAMAVTPDGRHWAIGLDNEILVLTPPQPDKTPAAILKKLEKLQTSPLLLHFRRDAAGLMAALSDGPLRSWELNFELAPAEPRAWNENDEKVLRAFLAAHPEATQPDETLSAQFELSLAAAGDPGLKSSEVEKRLLAALERRLQAQA